MKKLLLIFLVVLAAALVSPTIVRAVPPFNDPTDTGQAFDDFKNRGEVSSITHVADVETARQATLVCQMIGQGCTAENVEGAQTYFNNSVVGRVSNAIAYLYINKPADTAQFIAYYGQKMGLVQPAYAQNQGIGFGGLKPLLPLWQAFRNIAYGLIIIVMVIIGFMVMLRMKIDPRTVISVQNAIPRVLVTLFLITFSYAIAGLMIDVMYLSLFLFISVVRSSEIAPFPRFQEAMAAYAGGSAWALISSVFSAGMNSVNDIVAMIGGFTLRFVTGLIGAVIGGIVGGPLILFVPLGIPIGGILGAAAAPILVWLIVAVALTFAAVRILVMLLNAYINIIISILFGPLQLMLGAIPNTNTFGSWFKNLLANLIVFPLTSSLLLIGTILTHVAANNPNMWAAPGLVGSAERGVSGLIGLGMILTIPGIVNGVKETLKAKPAITAPAGAVLAPFGQIWGITQQALSASYYLSSPQSPAARIWNQIKKVTQFKGRD